MPEILQRAIMTRSNPSVDKGWAWVVLFAVFCNTTMLGMLYPSVAIFYVKFLDVFGESRSYTSWLGALNTVFMFSTTSLSSSILPLIGARNVLFIAGSCLMVAYVIMSLSHSLLFTIVTYGVLGGTGFGFMLTGGVSAVTRYFKRHLFKATSISFVGGGLGTLIYGPILEGLIATFGWRGSALFYAGISAHIILVGCVVFPERQPMVKITDLQQAPTVAPVIYNCQQSTAETVYNKLQPCMEEPVCNNQSPVAPVCNNQSPVAPVCNNQSPVAPVCTSCPTCITCKSSKETTTSEVIPIGNAGIMEYGNELAPQNPPTPIEKKPSTMDRFCNLDFWCLSYMALTWGFTITTFVGMFKDLVSTCGLLPYFQLAATASGIGNVLGRVLVGFLSFEHVILSFAAVFVMGASVTMSFTIATQFWILMTASSIMGLFLGATFLMLPTSVGAVYGRKDMAVMYGYVMFAIGVTSWIGPFLIGYLRDLTGTYDSGLYVLASIQLSGAFMAVALKLRMRNKAPKSGV